MGIKIIEDNEFYTFNKTKFYLSILGIFVVLFIGGVYLISVSPVQTPTGNVPTQNLNCFVGSYKIGDGGFSLNLDGDLVQNLYQRSLNFCN